MAISESTVRRTDRSNRNDRNELPSARKDKPDPSTPSAVYERMKKNWQIVEDLRTTQAMRDAGDKYLPKMLKEDTRDYEARKGIAYLDSAFHTGRRLLSAKPFGVEPKLTAPTEITSWQNDVDRAGNSLGTFARSLVDDALNYGIFHVLTDSPIKAGQEVNKGEVRDNRLYPFFRRVPPLCLLNWEDDDRERLTRANISIERYERDKDNEWKQNLVEYIYVYYPDKIDVYKKSNDKSKKWVKDNEMSIEVWWKKTDYIPIATGYGSKTGPFEGISPLQSVAELNVAHWRKSSELDTVLASSGAKLLIQYGSDQGLNRLDFLTDENDNIIVGEDGNPIAKQNPTPEGTGIHVPGTYQDSRIEFVQPKPEVADRFETHLKNLSEKMSARTGSMSVDRPGTRTATEAAISTAEELSDLESIIKQVELVLEESYRNVMQIINIKGDIDVEIDRDFLKFEADPPDTPDTTEGEVVPVEPDNTPTSQENPNSGE